MPRLLPLLRPLLRPLLPSFVAALTLIAMPARAASPVVWTLSVPPPTTTSTSSSLASIASDSAGDAFVDIELQNTSDVGGFPLSTPAGSQLFLLNPKGKVVGSVEVNQTDLNVLYVSAKRVIVDASGTLLQLAADSKGALIVTTLETQTQGETLLASAPLNEDFKFLHTSLTTNGFVSSVKRYLVTKLAP